MFNSDISLETHYGQSICRLVATELFKFPKEAMQRLLWLQEKKEPEGSAYILIFFLEIENGEV